MKLVSEILNILEAKKSKERSGVVKIYRSKDGDGYIIPDDDKPENTILFDKSALKKGSKDPDKGDKVKFKSEEILGRETATEVSLE